MPEISIIIPTFNRAHVLPRAIQSVLNQSFKDWELLVVDDFSTDNSSEVVAEFVAADLRIKYLSNKKKGANHARNLGKIESSGSYLVFLDSDDELAPKMLEVHLMALKSNPESFLSVSYSKIFRESDSSEVVSDSVFSDNLLLDFLVKKITWPINTVMIRKDFLLSKGIVFHPELLNGQDYSFFISILQYNPSIVFIHEVLSINHHIQREQKGVKVSAGNTLRHKVSRLRSRNLALVIAIKGLAPKDFLSFWSYYLKYQLGLIFDILRTGFR